MNSVQIVINFGVQTARGDWTKERRIDVYSVKKIAERQKSLQCKLALQL
jgi:hypothetical protein